jgi:ankyrin repeat protein
MIKKDIMWSAIDAFLAQSNNFDSLLKSGSEFYPNILDMVEKMDTSILEEIIYNTRLKKVISQVMKHSILRGDFDVFLFFVRVCEYDFAEERPLKCFAKDDTESWDLLAYAIMSRNLKVIKFILHNGGNPNGQYGKKTLLELSCTKADNDWPRECITKPKKNDIPLYIRDLEVSELLVEFDADPTSNDCRCLNKVILDKCRREHIGQWMINLKDKNGQLKIVEYYMNKDRNLELLQKIVAVNDIHLLVTCIEKMGYDLSKELDDLSKLHSEKKKRKRKDVAQIPSSTAQKRTLLNIALENKYIPISVKLLELGCNPNIHYGDIKGQCMINAVICNDSELVKAFIKYGADIRLNDFQVVSNAKYYENSISALLEEDSESLSLIKDHYKKCDSFRESMNNGCLSDTTRKLIEQRLGPI